MYVCKVKSVVYYGGVSEGMQCENFWTGSLAVAHRIVRYRADDDRLKAKGNKINGCVSCLRKY